jgi:hypothetical protein
MDFPQPLSRTKAGFAWPLVAGVMLAGLAACAPAVDPATQKPAPDKLDTATAPVRGCGLDEMAVRVAGLPGITSPDAAMLCKDMQAKFGALPETRVLRRAAKAATTISKLGVKDNQLAIAAALDDIAKARGQTKAAAILATFDVVTEAVRVTEGRVSPQAIAAALKASGPQARKLSNDALARKVTALDHKA